MSGVLVDERALAQLTAELSVTKQQLADARAALIDADHNLPLDEPPYFFGWRERHGKALKAARDSG